MAVSLTVATIPKPNVAAMKGQPIAAALLQNTTTNQQCAPVSFVADIDRAEKGISSPEIHPNAMKRATKVTAKDNAPPLAGNPNRIIEKEQASTTGANRYAEGNIAVENSIEQEFHEEIEAPRMLTRPTAASSSTSWRDGASSSEDKAAETEGGSNPDFQDTGYERFIDRTFESYPPGLPQLAAFLNSADSFAIARRFGTAHSRVLLHLECEITALEKELDELDEADSKTSTKYRLRRIEHHQGWDPAQKDLIDKLKLKLSEYDDLLLKDSSLRAMAPAPVRDHLSVFHWIYNNKPLDAGHYDFIYHLDDFVSLGKQPQSRFDDLVKACLNRWPNSRFQRFFRDEKESESNGKRDKHVYLFSSKKISRVAKIMAVSLAVTILLIPVFLLFLTHMSRKTTAIMVLAFVLAFATLMTLFTEAKAESIFIGTCTYCAVLVTFLGNLQGTPVGAGS